MALVALEILGALALAGLVWLRRANRLPAWFATLLLLVSLVAGALTAWTANLGGKIRHTEIGTEVKGLSGSRKSCLQIPNSIRTDWAYSFTLETGTNCIRSCSKML